MQEQSTRAPDDDITALGEDSAVQDSTVQYSAAPNLIYSSLQQYGNWHDVN